MPNPAARSAGCLNVLEIPASGAATHPDAFQRLRDGHLQAIVVSNVYSPEVLERVVARLERHDPPFVKTWFPDKFRSWFYGCNLNLAEPALAGYFEEAARFHAQLRELFDPDEDLADRVGSLLSALDHGRPFRAAPGPRPGQQYMVTTLRAHLEGGYLPPHFDNEQALRPSYGHLSSQVDAHMTSFVLTLQAGEAGGNLEVFDVVCDPAEARPINRDGAARPDIAGLEPVSFHVPAGSMIVLDSGRYLHRLSPVRGTRKRWTACSFMALARSGDATYCWG
jgi:hypothetical protein